MDAPASGSHGTEMDHYDFLNSMDYAGFEGPEPTEIYDEHRHQNEHQSAQTSSSQSKERNKTFKDQASGNEENRQTRSQALPTPQSVGYDPNGNPTQFISPLDATNAPDSGLFEEYSFQDMDDLMFTPLLSPAVTPMDSFQHNQTFGYSDDFHFSLSAPALSEDSTSYGGVEPPPRKIKRQNVVGTRSLRSSPSKEKTNRSYLQPSQLTAQHRQPQPPPHLHPSQRNYAAAQSQGGERNVESGPCFHAGTSSEVSSPIGNLESKDQARLRDSAVNGNGNVGPITPAILMQLQRQINEAPKHTPANTSSDPSRVFDTESQVSAGENVTSSTSQHGESSVDNSFSAPPPPSASKSRTHSRKGSMQAKSNTSPALYPSISPKLRPNGSSTMSQNAMAMLASRSNYQNIRDGNTEHLGLALSSTVGAGLDNRRSTHKHAEQRRRDCLKNCFDELKDLLPSSADEVIDSKIAILKKSSEYIVDLQKQVQMRDETIETLRKGSGSNGAGSEIRGSEN